MTPGLLEAAAPPGPPGHITPSGYVVLRECPMRFAWQSAGEPRRLPAGPAAHLGTVAHVVYERAERGQIGPGPEGARRAWDEAVEAEHQAMAADWLERPFVPLQRSARRYEEVRLATVRRVTRTAPAGDRRGGARREVEQKMRTPDGLVQGRSDLIVETAGGAVVRDNKTGNIFDRGAKRQVKPGLRDQLLLYAALYHTAHGRWPAGIELIPLAGPAVVLPYTPEEAAATLADATARLQNVRAALTAGTPDGSGLATPGEHCGHCPYRPVCPARPPAVDPAVDLSGTFESARPSRPGVMTLTVVSPEKASAVGGVDADPMRNPALGLLRPGDPIAIFNTRGVSAASYVATDYTVLYKVSSPS